MATTVDTLLVRVEADLRDVRKSLKQLEQDTKRTADKTSRGLKGIGNVAKAALGGVFVAAAGRASLAAVNFASDIEEMQAKSGVVFGQFASDVRNDLAAFADEVGRSRFELEGMAASVQDTFVPMGFARGEAADLSVQLAKLATDVASFNNASDVETMRAFQSALVGNHETVRRFGIVITEAELQAELFRMGITKSKDEISAAEKVQARLNLILAGTTDAQGDAARTADSYANKVKAMQASTDELSLAVGNKLMPIFLDFVDTIDDASMALANFLNAGQPDLTTVEGITEAQVKLRDEINSQIKAQTELAASVGTNNMGYRQGQIRLAELTAEYSNTEAALARLVIKQKEQAKAEAEAKKPKDSTEVEQAAVVAQKVGDALKDQRHQLELLNLEREGGTDVMLQLLEAEQKFGTLTGTQAQEYLANALAIKELKEELAGLEAIYDTIGAGVERFSDGASDALTNLITGVGDGMDNLKAIVSDAITQIIKKMIQMYVVNKAINKALGFFGAPEGMMLPTAATGGAVQPNKPVLVGERGPEIIIPHSASVVKNAADTRNIMAGGSGVTIHQNINVTTGVQATVRSEIIGLMPQIAASAKQAVFDAKTRGGSFAKAF